MICMDMALSSPIVSSSSSSSEIVKTKEPRFFLDIGILENRSAHDKILVELVSSFLHDKKLKYIDITLFGTSVAYYSKENFIEAMKYIKTNYDEFSLKSNAVKNDAYLYNESDLLYKSHTFSQEELLFWDQLSKVIFSISTQEPSKQNILQKIGISNLRHKKEVKNVLRFAPVGFAALAIILGYIKQMDDPQHITESKSRQKTDFGTYYTYTLEHKDLPNGLKILHLSDIHLGVNRPENLLHLERFAEEMDSVDFIFIT